jgi:hypothetical protein
MRKGGVGVNDSDVRTAAEIDNATTITQLVVSLDYNSLSTAFFGGLHKSSLHLT